VHKDGSLLFRKGGKILSEAKYSVVAQKLTELLTPDTAEFEVPPFQREYAWKAQQITQLIEDIFDTSPDDGLPYFLGSIVLAPKDEDDSQSDRTQILDGQQRLTTLSLIIAALGQKLSENGDPLTATRMAERALFSYEAEIDGPDERLPTKIRQQPGENRITYETLLEAPAKYRDKIYKSTRMGKGLAEIYRAFEDRVDPDLPQDTQAELYRKMLRMLLRQVEIVKITAPSEGDAFRLFETLNDRGLPLNQAELIKTKLFQQASSRDRELEDCKEAWNNVLAATRDDIVAFLRYYWIATHDFVRTQQLYHRYKKYISTLSAQQAGNLALQLYLAAAEYERILNPRVGTKYEAPEIVDALERLNAYRAKSCRTALLACSDNVLKGRESDLPKIVQVCESITVRYLIVGDRNPNKLENIYSEICQRLREPGQTLKEIFNTEPLSSRMTQIPSDEEFVNMLQEIEIETITPPWRQFLSRLYHVAGTRENKPAGPPEVHVEHIFPKSPTPEVFRESSLNDKETASKLTGRIGNLTLLSSEKNIIASNGPFSEKRKHYSDSDFLLTRRLATDYEKWGQNEIEARSRTLAELAKEVYRHPLKIVSEP
jgi:hypothetical protein